MDLEAVKTSYARWAPVYDVTFGKLTSAGRRRAVEYLNSHGPKVLEVGVGTGLSLRHYARDMAVTGIDASEEMLEKARCKVREHDLSQVEALRAMDARAMDFPDNSFDCVAAMHIVSVVPDPETVVAEMARVCKPGGCVVIVNHFAREKGLLAMAEKVSAPFANLLGWHSDFDINRVLGEPSLNLAERRNLPPSGMMTFLALQKQPLAGHRTPDRPCCSKTDAELVGEEI